MPTDARSAYVYDALRTPRGRARRGGGTLAGVPAHDLLATVLGGLSARGLPVEVVDDVVMGVSTTRGEQAGDVARVAVMRAGWPDSVPAGVVSRLCCSGLDAVASAAAQVRAGMAEIAVAGGVESMSRVPMLSDEPAFALDPGLGDDTGFVTIGVSADLTAHRYGFTRTDLDAYAVRSHTRAASASWGCVVPVATPDGTTLSLDEGARPDTTLDALGTLPALFGDDPLWARVEARFPGYTRPPTGLHTVATAPQMCDGASGVVIGSAAAASVLGRPPRARIASWAHHAVRSPGLDATLPAARIALQRAGINVEDLTVAEVNESFSVTPLLLMRELGLPEEIVNIHGGAVAVGHPLGATGGMLVAHATELLEQRGGWALVVIPAALGIAMALILEATPT